MKDKPVALVTGAGRGLGRAMAEALMDAGYAVFGCSRSEHAGLRYEHRVVDVTDEVAVRTLVGEIESTFARLDLLVNNAGIGLSALALMTPTADALEVLRTNLLGAMVVTREVAAGMVRRRSGRIVSIASVAVALHMQGASAYAASKAGLIEYTRVLAKELAPFGVTCNVIAPSLVATRMADGLSERATKGYMEGLTIKRPATVADVANALLFFASPSSGYVTGQVLHLGLVA